MDNQNVQSANSLANLPIPEEAKKALLEEMGIAGLPEDQQNELVDKMVEAILKRVLLETLEKLNEADQAAYEAMIDRNANPEEMEKFLQEKIPNYGDMVAKVVADFKEEMKKEI